MNKDKIELSIYGDNILECERMYLLIKKGCGKIINEEMDLSHIYSPLKVIENSTNLFKIQFYPDYKSKTRWHKEGLLNILVDHGANLTEAPDIILTKLDGEKEVIILAIEFSSALPAGNQAWQRSGRALSFSEVHIPYLYITDIGLEELDSERQSKAVRSSNPLVPLSYIKHSQRTENFTLTVLNPSQLLAINSTVSSFIVEKEVINLIKELIVGNSITNQIDKLILKTANYLDSYENIPENVSFNKWIETSDQDIEKLIKSFKLPKYNKKIANKTPIKSEMRTLIKDIIPEYALSIFNNIPICFIPSDKKRSFLSNLKSKCYPDIKPEVEEWLKNDSPLVVCIVNGFKPRGDDSRPDRGLVPFARMLFGFDIDLLALVFGQAPVSVQSLFKNDPIALAEKNGLWKSLLYYSSLTIADSSHWTLSNKNISQFSLNESITSTLFEIKLDRPSRIPIKFNENDIDTSIHLTFQSNKFIFESLCNPPGGDWSGIALLDNNMNEHRWMSLPRVSKNAKRPDHIFQITMANKSYLLIIESKENLKGLLKDQDKLGVGLIKYVNDLIKYPSSAIRKGGDWIRNNEESRYNKKFDGIFSAAAFIFSNPNKIKKAKSTLKVDLIIGFNINDHSLCFTPINERGELLEKILKEIKLI